MKEDTSVQLQTCSGTSGYMRTQNVEGHIVGMAIKVNNYKNELSTKTNYKTK